MTNKSWEYKLLDMMQDILDNGDDRMDRTGTGTRALFAQSLDINLKLGFPAVTTKKLAWKAVASEQIWFDEGSGDERRLAEILYGTRDPARRTIWSDNAEASYWKPKAKFEGDLGRVYGVQWRDWRKYTQVFDGLEENFAVTQVDQLAELINKLKTNPTDRRMIVSAWNPGELDQMALPPCHILFQCFLSRKGLSLQMYQRSADVFLGLPFDIASYALLTHMLAQEVGVDVDRLIIHLGDTHIYNNHFDAVKEQLSRTPKTPPTLKLNPAIKKINDFTLADMELVDYESYPAIKAPMAV